VLNVDGICRLGSDVVFHALNERVEWGLHAENQESRWTTCFGSCELSKFLPAEWRDIGISDTAFLFVLLFIVFKIFAWNHSFATDKNFMGDIVASQHQWSRCVSSWHWLVTSSPSIPSPRVSDCTSLLIDIMIAQRHSVDDLSSTQKLNFSSTNLEILLIQSFKSLILTMIF